LALWPRHLAHFLISVFSFLIGIIITISTSIFYPKNMWNLTDHTKVYCQSNAIKRVKNTQIII
jgi:ABC-type proline/glycine betaine transport system permease subunit